MRSRRWTVRVHNWISKEPATGAARSSGRRTRRARRGCARWVRVHTGARTSRGPGLSTARSGIDVGVVVSVKDSTLSPSCVDLGWVNFIGCGGASFEGIEATGKLREGCFCDMAIGTTVKCVDLLFEGAKRPLYLSRAVANLSKEDRIVASTAMVASATVSSTDFFRGSRAESMSVASSGGVVTDVRRSTMSEWSRETSSVSKRR